MIDWIISICSHFLSHNQTTILIRLSSLMFTKQKRLPRKLFLEWLFCCNSILCETYCLQAPDQLPSILADGEVAHFLIQYKWNMWKQQLQLQTDLSLFMIPQQTIHSYLFFLICSVRISARDRFLLVLTYFVGSCWVLP